MGSAMQHLVEIAALLVGLATVSVLVTRASGTSQVITSLTGGFANDLNAATLSGSGVGSGFGNNFSTLNIG